MTANLDLVGHLAKWCSYAQEHIDDLEAWPSGIADREDLLQCTSYQVACFVAQNTKYGHGGVPFDVVLPHLAEHPAKTPAEWEAILRQVIAAYGGLKEDRFYIVDIDESSVMHTKLLGWHGVVDDNNGGIVAYFKDEEQANSFMQTLISDAP
jgi:hypothetical protein